MTRKHSAGIVLYRHAGGTIELLLVHPGGPFWTKRDDGAWSIPKGEYDPGEDPLDAARRELFEETGCTTDRPATHLGSITQRGGKVVDAWAVEGTCDAESIRSNTFLMEWPPKSGRQSEFPEVDRAGWFTPAAAMRKLVDAQRELVTRLCAELGVGVGVGA
ncbi:MAG TPA: NUDIX domain-containing protein [Gemmatimonadaceae bacterium]|jgi:predicted NUDIX family NTP pyrophosphohydrolase|nr:NUDIX domain-containing protein [Gemmatimonadaceae bacterium]